MCAHHAAPFEAFADAYFARVDRSVWLASRGLGGKTVLMAALAMTEAITLGASVTILGGSGAQSQRVLDHMRGKDPLRGRFWAHPNAPRGLVLGDLYKHTTELDGGGRIEALMASQRSVRGPHPQRLRGDEIDEMDPDVWDAASGQPMTSLGIRSQIVGSSTHQHPQGTMTRELQLAAEMGWRVYEWCYRETMAEGGWLDVEEVERKRKTMPAHTFHVEVELQKPLAGDAAILAEAVEAFFDVTKGQHVGSLGESLLLERPLWELDPAWQAAPDDRTRKRVRLAYRNVRYAVGADWGKHRDKTIVWVLRTDTAPSRVVGFVHMGRRPYPDMIASFNSLVRRYDAVNAHDATGLGQVVDDYVVEGSLAVGLQGARRATLFSECVRALEARELVGPRIEYARQEFLATTTGDLYHGGSTAHAPDTFVALALAWYAARGGPVVLV